MANLGLLDAVREYVDPSTLLDPRYAAPEYFDRSFGDVDATTDVYQLGAVVYRLVTSRPPFRGDYETVREAVTGVRPPVPSEINPAIPEWIDAVIRKAMAKGKLTRYESVTQLVSELRCALEG